MDFLEWLKMKLSPTTEQKVNSAYDLHFGKSKGSNENKAASVGVPPWLDSLYKSPVADSLYQTSDVPTFLGAFKDKADPVSNRLGTYGAYLDRVRMNADQAAYENPRNTFIHEMGHRFASQNGVNPDAAYNPTGRWDLPTALYNRNTPQGKATLALDDYYLTDPREGYSQAFVNAFNFLSETARDPKMNYRKFAGDLEANTPGMGLIIQDLMKLPIFAKHPLQGQMFRTQPEKKK